MVFSSPKGNPTSLSAHPGSHKIMITFFIFTFFSSFSPSFVLILFLILGHPLYLCYRKGGVSPITSLSLGYRSKDENVTDPCPSG